MSKDLLKNTGIYIVVSFFTQVLVFFLWTVLAHWLKPEQIGIYVLVMFVVDLFSAISIFGLDSVVVRFYHAKEGVLPVLNSALFVLLISSCFSVAILLLFSGIISTIIPGLGAIFSENLFLFSVLIVVNSAFNFILSHYTALKRASDYAKLQFSKTSIFFIFAIILVHLGYDISGVFYALTFSFLPFLLLFLVKERGLLSRGNISLATIKTITSYGFPLMLYVALGVLVSYFGRLLLSRYADLAVLGIYSFFLVLVLQVNGFWGSFNRAWTPEIFSRFSEDKEKGMTDIKFMVFFSSFVYLMGLVLVIIIGELFVFKHIFNEIYLKNINLFYLLLIGPLFTGIYTAAYPLFYYENKTKKILALSIILSLISVLLSLVLIKAFGQQGAAISYFLISEITILFYLFSFNKAMDIPKEIINWTVLISILMIVAVIALLKTTTYVFLLFIIFGAITAFISGGLGKKINTLLAK